MTSTARTFWSLLYGSLTGAIMLILRRASRHTPIPFGPALIAGTFTADRVGLTVMRACPLAC